MPKQPSPTESLDSMSWPEKIEFMQGLMSFPALTLMVFARCKVGFRQLKPARLVGMAVLMLIVAYFANNAPGGAPNPIGGGTALAVYAIAMLGWGLYQRRQRGTDLDNGVRWHTRTTGLSWFNKLPVSEYVQLRYIDPIVCFIVGLIVTIISHALGLWLMFSAGALAVYEQALYERMLERQLDMIDGIVDSEVQTQVMRHFETRGNGQTPSPLCMKDTAGVPTGLAPDLRMQSALRQKRAPLSPDGTTAETDKNGLIAA